MPVTGGASPRKGGYLLHAETRQKWAQWTQGPLYTDRNGVSLGMARTQESKWTNLVAACVVSLFFSGSG